MQKFSSRCARKTQNFLRAARANRTFFLRSARTNAKFFFALRAQNSKIFFALRAQNAKLFFALHAENATSGLQSVCNHLASSLSFLSVLEKQLLVKKTVCLGSSLRCHVFQNSNFNWPLRAVTCQADEQLGCWGAEGQSGPFRKRLDGVC